MGSTPQGPYGKPPSGQPAPMQPGDFHTADYTSPPFGQRESRLRGAPRPIIVSQPAPGADWSYVHSGPSWFYLRSIAAKLVTSAAVASRIVRVTITFRSLLVSQWAPAATIAASNTVIVSASDASLATGDPATLYIPIATDIIITDGMTLASSTVAIQAGDQWSNIALLAEEFSCFDWCDE